MTLGRVLVVSNFFPPNGIGGAEIVAYRHAKLLREIGWRVSIFAGERIASDAPWGQNRWWQDEYDGFDITRVIFKQASDLGDVDFFDTTIASIFDVVLRKISPRVVHFHNLAGLGAGLIPHARRFGAKPIVTLHDRWGFCAQSILLRNDLTPCSNFEECHACVPAISTPDGPLPVRFRRDYTMNCFQAADTLIAPSPQIAADYEEAGIDRSRIEVLSSGIDLGSIPACQRAISQRITFLCAAYLGEHKGIRQLADALTELWRREHLHGRWRMLIAGEGHLAPFLHEVIREAGMQGAVLLLGRIPRPRLLETLSDAHVMVLPSICRENEPVSLLEGLASGAALVGSRIGGIPNLIQDGVNGRLYDPRDPAELASIMAELIVHPDKVVAYSRENLLRRPGYDEVTSGLRLASIYERPFLESTTRDIVVATGLAPPTAKTLVEIERAPARISHYRVRFLWWRWMSPNDVARANRFWLFRKSRNPMTWFQAWRLGARSLGLPRHAPLVGKRSPPPTVRP